TKFDFGTIPVDSSGNAQTTESFILANYGSANVTLKAVTINSGSSEFMVAGVSPGTVLMPGESVKLQVSFEPSVAASAAADLRIASDDPYSPFDINLPGFAQSTTPSASLTPTNNNLGGVVVGSSTQSPNLATITNQGLKPLTISA